MSSPQVLQASETGKFSLTPNIGGQSQLSEGTTKAQRAVAIAYPEFQFTPVRQLGSGAMAPSLPSFVSL